jgi:endonuclease/exonuclease/phosphatase family metal-dependent hydrolase
MIIKFSMPGPLFLLLLLSFFSCTQRVLDDELNDSNGDSLLVEPVGKLSAFEIATWNIENFPIAGTTTVELLQTLIPNLDIDLIAVQEISDIQSFNALLEKIPEWRGILSPDVYSSGDYQKTGVIYKSAFISVSSARNIFVDQTYAFPRPPLAAFVEVKDNTGVRFNFTLIVLHLKAMGGEENEARRLSACNDLKEFIDDEILAGADPDFIVMGDWNDEIFDPPDQNVFNAFLNDPDQYSFLTMSVTGQYSYISSTYKSLIDHILVTKDVLGTFNNGLTQVLYLDEKLKNFSSQISDHRPVTASFNGFQLNLAQ